MSLHKPVTPARKGLLRQHVPLVAYWPVGGAPVETFYLLKEDGDALLKEDGDHILKEDAI